MKYPVVLQEREVRTVHGDILELFCAPLFLSVLCLMGENRSFLSLFWVCQYIYLVTPHILRERTIHTWWQMGAGPHSHSQLSTPTLLVFFVAASKKKWQCYRDLRIFVEPLWFIKFLLLADTVQYWLSEFRLDSWYIALPLKIIANKYSYALLRHTVHLYGIMYPLSGTLCTIFPP